MASSKNKYVRLQRQRVIDAILASPLKQFVDEQRLHTLFSKNREWNGAKYGLKRYSQKIKEALESIPADGRHYDHQMAVLKMIDPPLSGRKRQCGWSQMLMLMFSVKTQVSFTITDMSSILHFPNTVLSERSAMLGSNLSQL